MNSRTTHNRLKRMEKQIPVPPCPICIRSQYRIVEVGKPLTDADALCPECGQKPPPFQVVKVLVGVSMDDL